jgi:hypothetical protein
MRRRHRRRVPPLHRRLHRIAGRRHRRPLTAPPRWLARPPTIKKPASQAGTSSPRRAAGSRSDATAGSARDARTWAGRAGRPAALPFGRVGELQGITDVSGWLTLDREHLDAFAFSTYLTEESLGRSLAADPGPTHDLVDGFLLLSLVAHAGQARPLLDPATTYAYNYGLDRVRFTRPVHIGESVRVSRTVTGVRLKTPSRALVVYEGTVDVAHAERPAVAATWLALHVDARAEAGQRTAGQ